MSEANFDQEYSNREKEWNACQAVLEKDKYILISGEGVRKIIPSPETGEISLNGVVMEAPFQVKAGDSIEFQPVTKPEKLTWQLEVRFYGMSVVAKVNHQFGGRYILPEQLRGSEEILLAENAYWEEAHLDGEVWDEAKLLEDLQNLKVVYGYRPECWNEIAAVKGVDDVEVAIAKKPRPTQDAILENFVNSDVQEVSEDKSKKIDFFASKVNLVKEGAVLARKIPGVPGEPGLDVFGKVYPVAAVRDFQFRLKKNVHLSEDGLEVLASCDGCPVSLDDRTYLVEKVYIQAGDVDLATGSIEFPGDVIISGNVQDGLRVFAGGMVEIRGSVSHAELRAEKGAKIQQNLIGGKVVIGGKFVLRSEMLRRLNDLKEQLNSCLSRTDSLLKAKGAVTIKPGLCLKIILEKQFPKLPRVSAEIEKFALEHKDEELVTENLLLTLRTAKQFLTGLGPVEPQSVVLLQRVDQSLERFIENLAMEIPDQLSLTVSYIQSANIECSGSLTCYKGTYNSEIRVDGNTTIEGVCRGGRLYVGGNASIKELGGSEVSSTFVQISPHSKLLIDYCHANVVIAVGKEIIRIEEPYRKVEIYRDKGVVQMDKLRVNPNQHLF